MMSATQRPQFHAVVVTVVPPPSFLSLICFVFCFFLFLFSLYMCPSVRPSVVEQRFTTFTSVTLSLFVGAVILGKTSSLSSLLFFVNSLSIIIGCCCCCWVGSSVLLLFLSWVELKQWGGRNNLHGSLRRRWRRFRYWWHDDVTI